MMHSSGSTDDLVRRVAAWTAGVLAAALMLGAPSAAHGQDDGKFDLDGYGGVAIAGGNFAQLPLDDLATNFGASVGWHVHPRVTLRADGNVELWSGDTEENADAPDFTLFHYTAGAEAELTPPEVSRWDITINAGFGATSVSSDEFPALGETHELSETWFTGHGGVNFGYDVHRRATVYVGGQFYIVSANSDVTRPLAELTVELQEGFDTISTFPVYAGLKIDI